MLPIPFDYAFEFFCIFNLISHFHPFLIRRYTSDLDKTKYKENVLKKLRDHLRRINVILSVSEVSHQAKPIERDMLIDGNVYFSTLNRKALEAIKDLAENSLGELKSSNKNWLYMFTIGLAVAGSFMIFR